MRIEFHCPHCSAVVKAEKEQAGRTVRCPKCRRTFELVLPKSQNGKKTEKPPKKKKHPPTPVVNLGGIFIIDNTGSPDIGEITDVKSGELPFKLPTASAKEQLSPKEPLSPKESLSPKEPAAAVPTTGVPNVTQSPKPPETPKIVEPEEKPSDTGVLDLPKFDLSAFEHQPPEFDDSVESAETIPVVLDETQESADLDDLASADDSPFFSAIETDEKPTQKAVQSPDLAGKAMQVKKTVSSVPVPNSETDTSSDAASDTKSDTKPEITPAADPFRSNSAPISMPSLEGDSNFLSRMIIGLVILAGTAAVVVGGLRLLDSKGTSGGDSMAEFQRTMEIAAKDPAGPFQTTTELIEGKMTLTHESEDFVSKSVEFNDTRIEIQRLRDEGFPDALIKRYVESDSNSDGFVDETELEKMLHY